MSHEPDTRPWERVRTAYRPASGRRPAVRRTTVRNGGLQPLDRGEDPFAAMVAIYRGEYDEKLLKLLPSRRGQTDAELEEERQRRERREREAQCEATTGHELGEVTVKSISFRDCRLCGYREVQ